MYPRPRYGRRRRFPWAWLFLVGAIATAVVALFLPLQSAASLPTGPCSNPLDPTCIPDTLTLANLTVTSHSSLSGMTHLGGDVICANPIWPSCLDISGQGCMTPLQESCLPGSVTDWNVNGTLMSQDTTLKGTTTCLAPIDPGCLPSNLTLNQLTVTNLTTIDFTHVNMEELNQTTIVTDYLTVNNSITCGTAGALDAACVDISGETCSAPVDESCIPDVLTSKLMCDTRLNGTCIDISGHGTCTAPIAPDCVPQIPVSSLLCDVELHNTCLNISGEVCPAGPVDGSCIPSDLVLDTLVVQNLTAVNFTLVDMSVVNKTTIDLENLIANHITFNSTLTCTPPATIDQACLPSTPTSKLTCDVKLDPTCIDISGHGACSAAVAQSCIDISGETCTAPINQNCVDISGQTCTIPINANCVDISGETCTAPVDPSCIPVVSKDVQEATGMNMVSTGSTTFVDVPAMTLTVSNAGTGGYLATATLQMEQTVSSTMIHVIFNVAGVDNSLSERTVRLETGNPNVVVLHKYFSSVPNGSVIKIRWKKDGPGTISVANRAFTILQV